MKKICSVCSMEKEASDFHKKSSNPDGLRYDCKSCRKDESNKYYTSNKENVQVRVRKYRQENPEKVKEFRILKPDYDAKYREDNKEHYKEWRNKNKEKLRLWRKEYMKNPQNRIKATLRSRLSVIVKNKKGSTFELLGCDLDSFLRHIESQFSMGMSWENYGEWHLDHIRPCCSFDFAQEGHQQECFHYSNFQPLWASENLSKSGRWAA